MMLQKHGTSDIALLYRLLNPKHTTDEAVIRSSQWSTNEHIHYALQSMESKRHTSYRSYSTKINKENYWSTALKRLHELKLYSLQIRRERYMSIYIWKIQHMGPNIDGTIGHKIKTRKHPWHGTQCVIQYPINKQKSSTIPSRKCNNRIWASVVRLVAKITENHRKC